MARRDSPCSANEYCLEILPTDALASDQVEWESLRSTRPLSNKWGLDRGVPIDRYYIHKFLRDHRSDIRGEVLEVKEPVYTQVFGSSVSRSHVVDIDTGNPKASTLADLGCVDSLPNSAFDCFVLTQTLHLVFEIQVAIENIFQALKPNGVVLATLPCVSRIDPASGTGHDYWRFTGASAEKLFKSTFGEHSVETATFGNVLTCSAFLHGLATSDLTRAELEFIDPEFPLVACVRAAKLPA
jgi:SAM-dependent methyltransferase